MFTHNYLAEKLAEFEAERATRQVCPAGGRRRSASGGGPARSLAAVVGVGLRRLGEGLEAWGRPAATARE